MIICMWRGDGTSGKTSCIVSSGDSAGPLMLNVLKHSSTLSSKGRDTFQRSRASASTWRNMFCFLALMATLKIFTWFVFGISTMKTRLGGCPSTRQLSWSMSSVVRSPLFFGELAPLCTAEGPKKLST